MRTVVVYHSQTGFTRRYAEWIADAAGGDCFALKEARKRDLSGYDAIVYGGWACAGQISKIGWFEEQIPAWNGKRLAAFCVGASPADNPEVQVFLDKTEQDLAAQNVKVFYCPGGMNYEAMSLRYRLMMKAFLAGLRAKKDRTPQEETMAAMLGSSYDISDRRYIEPVLAFLSETQKDQEEDC